MKHGTSAWRVSLLQSAFEFIEAKVEGETGEKAAARAAAVATFINGGQDVRRGGCHIIPRRPLQAVEAKSLQDHVAHYLDALHTHQLVNPPEHTITLGPPLVAFGAVTPSIWCESASDGYLLALALLVGEVGGERILKCPYCGRAFLKVGRRLHCHRPECERKRAGDYWQRYRKTSRGRRVIDAKVDAMYKAHGWTRGARKRKAAKKRSRKARKSPVS